LDHAPAGHDAVHPDVVELEPANLIHQAALLVQRQEVGAVEETFGEHMAGAEQIHAA
jgi:hypothetical protein